MVMHARSGGTLEVMGLLLGKVTANTMLVMDSFALPVEGTETRVNAQAQAYEYMTAYIESAKQVCAPEKRERERKEKEMKKCIAICHLGWKARKCYRMVSQSSRIWLLVVRYRRFHTNAQSKFSRTFCRDCH